MPVRTRRVPPSDVRGPAVPPPVAPLGSRRPRLSSVASSSPRAPPASSTSLPQWAISLPACVPEEVIVHRVRPPAPLPKLPPAPRPTLSVAQLVALHRSLAEEVSSALHVHFDIAFPLLQLYRWLPQPLYEDYCTNNSHVWQLLGIPESWRLRPLTLSPSPAGPCAVCLDDFPADSLFSLPCGHAACEECWRGHLQNSVESGLSSVRCVGCGCPVSLVEIQRLSGRVILEDYENGLARADLLASRARIPCIRPDCPHVLTVASLGCDGVAQCVCGTRVCWRCREADHTPLPCAKCEHWRRADAERDFVEWVSSGNAQQCPKCRVHVEKFNGCNHMACICGCSFCYRCGRTEQDHKKGFPCSGSPLARKKGLSTLTMEAVAAWRAARAALERDSEERAELLAGLQRTVKRSLAEAALAAVLRARDVGPWAIAYAAVFAKKADSAVVTMLLAEMKAMADAVVAAGRGEAVLTAEVLKNSYAMIEADVEMIRRIACCTAS